MYKMNNRIMIEITDFENKQQLYIGKNRCK